MEQFLTEREVAKRYGISVRSLHRHVKTGAVPAPAKLVGSIRWREKVIDQHLRQMHPDLDPEKEERNSQ